MKIAFDEVEQLTSDLDWYAVDRDGRIGHFMTGGSRLLPLKIAADKTALIMLHDYFETLSFSEGDFKFCPQAKYHFILIGDDQPDNAFHTYAQKMAARGLYTFDSRASENPNRPYYRVTIPNTELNLSSLPDNDIKSVLSELRFADISFADRSIVLSELADKL